MEETKQSLRFADDIAVISDSVENLLPMLSDLYDESKKQSFHSIAV